MNKIVKFLYALLTLVLPMTFCGCIDDDDLQDKVDDIYLEVSEITQTSANTNFATGPFEYMLVRTSNEKGWKYLSIGAIEGFTYEFGHRYELKVRRTTLANPPMDGGGVTYKLLQVVANEDMTKKDEPSEPTYNPTSEQELKWLAGCPMNLYTLTPSELDVHPDGKVGAFAYDIDYGCIALPHSQDMSNNYYQKLAYQPYKVYIVEVTRVKPGEKPISEPCFKMEYRGHSGFAPSRIIPQSDYDTMMDSATPVGTTFTYRMIVANVHSYAIQQVEFKVTKSDK